MIKKSIIVSQIMVYLLYILLSSSIYPWSCLYEPLGYQFVFFIPISIVQLVLLIVVIAKKESMLKKQIYLPLAALNIFLPIIGLIVALYFDFNELLLLLSIMPIYLILFFIYLITLVKNKIS